ncbi:plasmid recombination protein [Palleronia sp. LCG004]|uniref:plasmid recombination protein n=1 Tax=Palleronia sp. LCG004 TaxID=3079304 RepID=UPI0029429F5C|nr:plasmid recombination protein [Palleronia sp. LCG004]WOI56083.1 plasmid recombination protein [Palleronia sp. LCG004]
MDGSQLKTDYPVVLRFEGLYPHQLGSYEAHRLRKGGDLSHVDRERTKLNGPPLIGPEDWASLALAEIREMTAKNFAAELEALEKRKRKKDIQRRLIEGPKQPWRPTRHGPMREVILTVNKDWFAGDLSNFFGEGENHREKEFGELAVGWLKENFGDDVIHARADRDEAAYHIHAVIMPRANVEIAKPGAKVPTATATRRMLQPSIHPLIKDYEAAQDSVGHWFKDLGLVRGERTAAASRDARENGEERPKRRYHAKTWKWRAEQEQRLLAERQALDLREEKLSDREGKVEEREAEAETVLAVAEGVVSGALVVETADDDAAPVLTDAPKVPDATLCEPTVETLRKRSPRGFARAANAFERAWFRLFGEARKKAKAEAQAKVTGAMAQIEKADAKIVEATRHLPREVRETIAGIRQTIPAILSRLERRNGGMQRDDDGSRDERKDRGDGEKF